MSTDLSDPARWHTWTGNRMTGAGTGEPPLPCLRNDGVGDGQRHATHRTYGPFRLHGWFEWLTNRDPSGPDYLGLHCGLLQDNDHGYHFSIRKDRTLRLLVETHGYSELTAPKPTDIRPGDGKRHQFTFIVTPDTVIGTVDGTVVAEDDGAHHRFPRMTSGRVGLRLDRQLVLLGALVVEEL